MARDRPAPTPAARVRRRPIRRPTRRALERARRARARARRARPHAPPLRLRADPRWASVCRRAAESASPTQPVRHAPCARWEPATRAPTGTRTRAAACLPRVARWSFWNAPKLPAWLQPQFARGDEIIYAAAAVRYRSLAARAPGPALLRARRDEMLLGETGPIGRTTGPPATRPVAARPFLRTLLCLDAADAARRAAAAGCTRPRRLAVTGFAHHPTRAAAPAAAARASRRRRSRSPRPAGWSGCSTRRRDKRRLPRRPADPLHGVRLPDRTAEGCSASRSRARRSTSTSRTGSPSATRASAPSRSTSWSTTHRLELPVRAAVSDGRPSRATTPTGCALGRARAAPRDCGSTGRCGRRRRATSAGSSSRTRRRLQRLPHGRDVDVRARNGAFVRTLPRREGRFRLRWGSVRSARHRSRGE